MDPTLKTMKDRLAAIRCMATNALSHIKRPQEEYSMRWSCKACGFCISTQCATRMILVALYGRRCA